MISRRLLGKREREGRRGKAKTVTLFLKEKSEIDVCKELCSESKDCSESFCPRKEAKGPKNLKIQLHFCSSCFSVCVSNPLLYL